MAERKIIWSAKTLIDLEAHYDFLSSRSPDAAKRIAENILERVEQLQQFAESGSPELRLTNHSKNYHYLVEGNYKIIYLVNNDSVVITRIFDARQNPSRLKP
jgi:Plasmid stabilization system protein